MRSEHNFAVAKQPHSHTFDNDTSAKNNPASESPANGKTGLNLVDFEQLEIQYGLIETDDEWSGDTCRLVRDIVKSLSKDNFIEINKNHHLELREDLAEFPLLDYHGRDEFLRDMLTKEWGEMATPVEIRQLLDTVLDKLMNSPEQFSTPQPQEFQQLVEVASGAWRFTHDQLLQNAARTVSASAQLVGAIASQALPQPVQSAFTSIVQFGVTQGVGNAVASAGGNREEIQSLINSFSSATLMSQMWQFVGDSSAEGQFLSQLGSTVSSVIAAKIHGQPNASLALQLTSHLPGLFSSAVNYTGAALPEMVKDFASQWNGLVTSAGISSETVNWITSAVTAASCIYAAVHAMRNLVKQPAANHATLVLETGNRVRQMLDQVAALPEKHYTDRSYSGPRQITDASVAKYPNLNTTNSADTAARSSTVSQPESTFKTSAPESPKAAAVASAVGSAVGSVSATLAGAAAGLAAAGPAGAVVGGLMANFATADSRPVNEAQRLRITPQKPLFPHQNVVTLKIVTAINDKLSEINQSGAEASPVFRKMLLDTYLYEMHDLYRARSYDTFQPVQEKIKNELNAERASRDPSSVAEGVSEADWQDAEFILRVADKMLSGEQMLDQITPLGKLDDQLKMLLSDKPPMLDAVQQAVNERLNDWMNELRHSFIKNDFSEELMFSFEKILTNHFKLNMDMYQLDFSQLKHGLYNEGGGLSVSVSAFGEMVRDYQLWFSDKHQQMVVDKLTTGGHKEVQHELKKIVNHEEMIAIGDVLKSGAIIEQNIVKLKNYLTTFDYIGFIEKNIDSEIKKIPGLENKNGTDLVYFSKKGPQNKNVYTFQASLKEIACGALNRRRELRGLSVDNPQAVEKLRNFSDQFEKHYLDFANKIYNDPLKQDLKDFHNLAFKMNLRSFVKSADFKQLPEAKRNEFSAVINKFLKGDPSIRPLLLEVQGKPLSDVIALEGKAAAGQKNTNYLLIPASPKNCTILPFTGVISDEKQQNFLLSHLSASDASSEKMKNAFKPAIAIRPGLEMPNFNQIHYSTSENYQEELVHRYVESMKSNVNTLFKTNKEAQKDDIVAHLKALSLVTLPLSFMVPGSLLGVAAMLAVEGAFVLVPLAIEYSNAESEEQREAILSDALMDLAFAVAGEVIPAGALKAAVKSKISSLKLAAKQADQPGLAIKLSSDEIFTSGSFRTPENLIGQDATSQIYKLNDGFIVKDFNFNLKNNPLPDAQGSFKLTDYNHAMKEINNNAIALNRMYGEGSASVLKTAGEEGLSATISVKLKALDGQPLENLLKAGTTEDFNTLKKALDSKSIDSFIEQSVDKLKKHGIHSQHIDSGNILFDKKTNQFRLVNFEKAEINVKKVVVKSGEARLETPPLSSFQAQGMKDQLRKTFDNVISSVDKTLEAKRLRELRPLKLEIDPEASLQLVHCVSKRGIGGSKLAGCGKTKIVDAPTEEQLIEGRKELNKYFNDPMGHQVYDKKIQRIYKAEDLDRFKVQVKSKLYRSHYGTTDEILAGGVLRKRPKSGQISQNFDKYLQTIFIHTGGTGTKGKALSLTPKLAVAEEFHNGAKNSRIVEIDVDPNEMGLFMCTSDVIKTYGGYAYQKGLIGAEELDEAINQLANAFNEGEMFFMGKYENHAWGDLPISEVKITVP